jgi:NAD(P)-dependent dehydrogenase (short-subunit alcohol dehydrogenase family)
MKNRHLFLSGGTGGLGSSVARQALQKGALVTIPYRKLADVERLQKSLKIKDPKILRFVPADLTEEEQVAKVFKSIDPPDIVIHLVGGFAMGETDKFAFADWQRMLDLNLTSTFLVCKYALQKMKINNYGRIVTVSARAALQPAGRMAAYCAAKAGVIALTRSIAEETKGSGITANCILPSIIDTPANRQTMGEQNSQKWVKPQSLATVICFLASEGAADIRGAVLPVYGDA